MKLRPKHVVAAGAAVVGMLFAGPAIAGAGQASDPGRQPPAGSSVEKKSDFRLGQQPVNRNPQKVAPVPKVRDTDRGAENVRPTKDLGKKNVPPTRDLGAR